MTDFMDGIDWSQFPVDDAFKGMTPEDFVGMTLPDLSFEMHLRAMRDIIRRGRESLAKIGDELDAINARGEEHGLDDREQDHRGELFYEHMFLSSANSLVASALMAAFLDRFFSALFTELKESHGPELTARNPGHVRWTMTDEPWLPAKATVAKRGLAFGLAELTDAIGLVLPERFGKLYDVLTTYRNNALHDSLEWAPQRIADMTDRIEQRGWDEAWFDVTKTGHGREKPVPSMYALHDRFVSEMLESIDEMLRSVGEFLKVLRFS
ncbi:MAG TPA: hypothetical protein VL017_00385 [Devosia sp.]|nr:hypothetical protein [Devosia sp.]